MTAATQGCTMPRRVRSGSGAASPSDGAQRRPEVMETDIAIIGAGAAGLAAAIFAGQAAGGGSSPDRPTVRIDLFEGARRPGAKILVSGGGRCNVTHRRVTPEDYCGGPAPIIRSVLKSFDESATLAWMRELGVNLKLEETGKFFPVTDSARTVLEGLLGGVRRAGVRLHSGARMTGFAPEGEGFRIDMKDGPSVRARRVIMATGGRALPKSGSDGAGLDMLRELGHTIVPLTPALVPLTLQGDGSPGGRLRELSGITIDARLRVRSASGRILAERTDALVFTHFGLSGPGPMNLSRHWLRDRLEHSSAHPVMTLGHPALADVKAADRWLLERAKSNPKQMTANALTELWPARMAAILAGDFGPTAALRQAERRELATRLADLPLPVRGDRGWSFAETTAGGVDLREIRRATMESRVIPGLHLCGELLDADGRIGGFSFQWAWASGRLAGLGAVEGLRAQPPSPDA